MLNADPGMTQPEEVASEDSDLYDLWSTLVHKGAAVGQRHLDEAEIAKIRADGWRDIRWRALKVQSRLLLSPDPYTLECNTEWCDQLAC